MSENASTCVANTAPPFKCDVEATMNVRVDFPAYSNWRGYFPASTSRYRACPAHAAAEVARYADSKAAVTVSTRRVRPARVSR